MNNIKYIWHKMQRLVTKCVPRICL